MAKRFHDTEIWNQDWFLEMPGEYQVLWLYIKDRCCHAGIWKPEKKFAEMIIGKPIDLKKALSYLNNGKERIQVLGNGRWYLVDFVRFQYGDHLNPNSRMHASVLRLLSENGVKLRSTRGQVEGKDRVKDKDTDKDTDSSSESYVSASAPVPDPNGVETPRVLPGSGESDVSGHGRGGEGGNHGIRDYTDIDGLDAIEGAIALTGERDAQAVGFWRKMVAKIGQNEFKACLRGVFGEMKQGEVKKPGAILALRLRAAGQKADQPPKKKLPF